MSEFLSRHNKAIVWAFRILVGAVFIVSGTTKMIDVWGFVYKIEQYLNVWSWPQPRSLVLVVAMGLSALEFLTGWFLITGCYKRTCVWLMSLTMLGMLPLTLYIAIANPVSDCGCFGDFLLISNTATFIKNVVISVMLAYLLFLASAQYGNNPMFQEVDVNTLDAANYNEILDMIRLSTANAADYTFVFVGNVDIETLKPLLEQYVATLPAKKGKSVVKDLSPITIASGQVIDNFKQPMHSPKSQVYAIFSGTNVPYSIENSVKLSTIGQILRMVFTETLREEMGGTYSPAAGAVLNPYTGQWMVIYTYETNAEMLGKMEERANAEFLKLLNDGAKEEDFNKVKEATMKQYEMNVRNNGYWENNLVMLEKGFDDISGHKAAIENLTLQELNKFMKNLYNGKNRIEVIMEGIESK